MRTRPANGIDCGDRGSRGKRRAQTDTMGIASPDADCANRDNALTAPHDFADRTQLGDEIDRTRLRC